MATAGKDVAATSAGGGRGGRSRLESGATKRRLLQDHPLVAWLLENGSIVALCLLRLRMLPAPKPGRLLQHALINISGGIFTTESSILVQYLLVKYVYAHRPYFQKDESRLPASYHDWKLALRDWISCNGVTYAVLGVFTAWLDQKTLDKPHLKPFRLWQFLKKMAIVRLVVDVAFYVRYFATIIYFGSMCMCALVALYLYLCVFVCCVYVCRAHSTTFVAGNVVA